MGAKASVRDNSNSGFLNFKKVINKTRSAAGPNLDSINQMTVEEAVVKEFKTSFRKDIFCHSKGV